MNTKVSWSMEGVARDTRDAALDAARRSGQSLGDWLDGVIADRAAVPSPAAPRSADHAAEMDAIAAQLARITGMEDGRRLPLPRKRPSSTGGDASVAAPGLFDARAAVSEIARRQADLDRRSEAPLPTGDVPPLPMGPRRDPAPWLPSSPATDGTSPQLPAGGSRPGPSLTTEVSQTFARFTHDLHDAIRQTDARPQVEALDRHMRRIGRAVDGLADGRPDAEAIARIGEQTREMRDLFKASTDRAVPLDAVERQVASLEARLAALPVVSPPEFSGTMAEVRALLEGFKPGATMAALEGRLDDITGRIERGLDAGGPAGLIEGLSRRVDEIHMSLRSQLAASAVDTRPLEGLVRGLSDRIGQAREASTDFQQLEVAMREVSSKIDGAASGLDPRGALAIEGQLARLAERLDRSETSLRALDGVEQSLGELFSQFEMTRQVAIEAAETAARTAARDTLRAALQSPGLSHRPVDASPALADQMARGLDDLRTRQDEAERRTQTTLSDIRATVERLALGLGGDAVPAPRDAPPLVGSRRRRDTAAKVVADPADTLIEPGLGIAPSPRTEPRFASDESTPVDDAPPAAALEADGPASFIAAARRAAQAAQASVASSAAGRRAERGPAVRPDGATPRRRASAAQGTGALARARTFLAARRRPILLGLAALVLLVGALEVVKLGIAPDDAARTGRADRATPAKSRVATAGGAIEPAVSQPTASVPPAVLPPASAPVRAPLPAFVAGPARAQVAPVDGISEALRALAAAGDPAAQYEVGLRYTEGRGVARDAKQAVAWFEKAAAQGSAPAEYRLGSAYEKGTGIDRDASQAMARYGKAADAGNIRAMHNLAVMSAEGAVGKPDYAKAAQWFGKASTYGVRDSQFNLAILYARGLGIEQSLPRSYEWFAIAAAEGDDDAAKKRDEVAAKLDPQALASAKSAADAYRAAVPPASANDVAPPPGGWDAALVRTPASAVPSSASPAKVSRL